MENRKSYISMDPMENISITVCGDGGTGMFEISSYRAGCKVAGSFPVSRVMGFVNVTFRGGLLANMTIYLSQKANLQSHYGLSEVNGRMNMIPLYKTHILLLV